MTNFPAKSESTVNRTTQLFILIPSDKDKEKTRHYHIKVIDSGETSVLKHRWETLHPENKDYGFMKIPECKTPYERELKPVEDDAPIDAEELTRSQVIMTKFLPRSPSTWSPRSWIHVGKLKSRPQRLLFFKKRSLKNGWAVTAPTPVSRGTRSRLVADYPRRSSLWLILRENGFPNGQRGLEKLAKGKNRRKVDERDELKGGTTQEKAENSNYAIGNMGQIGKSGRIEGRAEILFILKDRKNRKLFLPLHIHLQKPQAEHGSRAYLQLECTSRAYLTVEYSSHAYLKSSILDVLADCSWRILRSNKYGSKLHVKKLDRSVRVQKGIKLGARRAIIFFARPPIPLKAYACSKFNDLSESQVRGGRSSFYVSRPFSVLLPCRPSVRISNMGSILGPASIASRSNSCKSLGSLTLHELWSLHWEQMVVKNPYKAVGSQLRDQCQLRDQSQLPDKSQLRDQSQLRNQSQLRVPSRIRVQTQLRDQCRLRVISQLQDQTQL
ncbi:unnamed protein product [Nesidiocoris tenuis]|uniref:Uncharacterized protein n=1 Tax=Nesidiocoris tenuis TaxID=355587 RepID=A0A6H5HAI6_9HEMI|nr:unnamed protein product [Nesidiocoris tenuis]